MTCIQAVVTAITYGVQSPIGFAIMGAKLINIDQEPISSIVCLVNLVSISFVRVRA